jgi:hypothetical protein
MEPEGSLPCSQQPTTCSYPEARRIPFVPFQTHFNIFLPYTTRSSKWSHLITVPPPKPCIFLRLHTCHMPSHSTTPLFAITVITWGPADYMKLLTMQLYPVSRYCLSLRYKRLPRQSIPYSHKTALFSSLQSVTL